MRETTALSHGWQKALGVCGTLQPLRGMPTAALRGPPLVAGSQVTTIVLCLLLLLLDQLSLSTRTATGVAAVGGGA